MSEDEPVQHCTLAEPADLRTALGQAAIEHLDVEFWEKSPTDSTRDPDEFLTAIIEERVVTTDATRAES